MWLVVAKALLYTILVILTIYCFLTICLIIAKVTTEPLKAMCNCTARLDDKIVLVTGGNSGIGFETAKDLARRGARVIIADVNNAEGSVKDIITATGNKKVEYRHLNLADFKSIRAFANEFNNTVDHLDILVNNAGCLIETRQITKNGIDMIMQVNYFGPYLLTNLIMEKLLKRKSRIVIVASGMYYKGDVNFQDLCGLKTKNFFKRYMNSKLCTVLWTKALSKKLPENVSVFCLHPGMVSTNIFLMGRSYIGKYVRKSIDWVVRTPYEGAQTSIHACIAPDIEKYTGSYFSNCRLSPMVKIKNEETLIEDLWNETAILIKDKEL